MQDRTKRLSRLGNAVVPDCAEWIARRLKGKANRDVRLA
jgi:site-specific DNA-cytosine methylase